MASLMASLMALLMALLMARQTPRPPATALAALLGLLGLLGAAGCLDEEGRNTRFRVPPDAALPDAGVDDAGRPLPPCDRATDPVGCCVDAPDRAPCCAPPDPATLTCPEGATEERADDGSFTCRAPGADGIPRAIGPFVAFFGPRVVSYGTIEDGGESYQCDPTTSRMTEIRRHSTREGDPSPGRVTCSLACWDAGGDPTACATPCAE